MLIFWRVLVAVTLYLGHYELTHRDATAPMTIIEVQRDPKTGKAVAQKVIAITRTPDPTPARGEWVEDATKP